MTTLPATGVSLDVDVVRAAATELVGALPIPVPLTPVEPGSGGLPAPDTAAVRVGFVGAMSAELILAAGPEVVQAISGATGVSLADTLRPALETAAATLGSGALDTAVEEPVADSLTIAGVTVMALVDSTDTPRMWFGMRARTIATVPHQRSGAQAGAPDAPAADAPAPVPHGMRLLHDVEMTLTAEIGRTKLPVRQVLELVPGTVLELDRAAGSPADVMVNGRLVARGEVVVIDEDYGIRITEIVSESATA
jgi:flagellar motor switch protein FliN